MVIKLTMVNDNGSITKEDGSAVLPQTTTAKVDSTLWIILILAVLFLVSVVWLVIVLTWKNNSRTKKRAEKNVTYEIASFIVPYVVSFVLIDYSAVNLIIVALLFVFLGVIFVYSRVPNLNPIFVLCGYKLYKTDDRHYILSKKSLDAINIEIADNLDGIPARELERELLIMLPR
jgi:hypothetical protein